MNHDHIQKNTESISLKEFSRQFQNHQAVLDALRKAAEFANRKRYIYGLKELPPDKKES